MNISIPRLLASAGCAVLGCAISACSGGSSAVPSPAAHATGGQAPSSAGSLPQAYFIHLDATHQVVAIDPVSVTNNGSSVDVRFKSGNHASYAGSDIRVQRKDAEIARMPQSANGGYCIGSEYFAYYDQATYFSETPDSPGATFTLQVAVPSYDQGGINVTHHTYVYSPFGYSWDSGTETDYFNGYTQVQTAVALDTDWGKLQLWYYATDANNVSWDGEGVKDSCRRTL